MSKALEARSARSMIKAIEMAKHVELVLTSDGSGQSWNVCAWNHGTGSALKTFKGGSSAPRTLTLIDNAYLMSAQIDKPVINFWSLTTKDQAHQKMITPGRINCLSITYDGCYCAAGIAEKIHIWQICSGNLMAVVSKHYQSITCVKFTDDGSHLVSGSEDTTVLAWSLSDILTADGSNLSSASPVHKWTQHSGAVTDVHVGPGGIRARVVSVSTDRTCKVHDLLSGASLLSVVFDVGLTAVVVDDADVRLFAGASDGRIFRIDLVRPPRGLETQADERHEFVLHGHSKKISCLSVSSDGSLLVSGCHDWTAKIWHVQSGHCLATLGHKGPVTNAFFTQYVDSFASNWSERPSNTILRAFKRTRDDVGPVYTKKCILRPK